MIPYGKRHSVAVSWGSPLTAYSTFIYLFKSVTVPEGHVPATKSFP